MSMCEGGRRGECIDCANEDLQRTRLALAEAERQHQAAMEAVRAARVIIQQGGSMREVWNALYVDERARAETAV